MIPYDLSNPLALLELAKDLKLYGLVANWSEFVGEACLPQLLQREYEERAQRSLVQRTLKAKIPYFKALADFDYAWPKKIDRLAIEDLMTGQFIGQKCNVVFIGDAGLGKTTLACNLAYQGLLSGHTVLFRTANQILGDLVDMHTDRELRQRLTHYVSPSLLVIDEIGYQIYSDRMADLLFELISRRYQTRSTIVTTNRPFAQWGGLFPNATCVYALTDRLVHNSEVITIEGSSYRLKEAQERAAAREKERQSKSGAADQAKKATVRKGAKG